MEDSGNLKHVYRKVLLISSILLFIAIIVIIIALFLKPTKYTTYFNEEYKSCLTDNEQAYYLLLIRKTGDRAYCNKLAPEQAELCMQPTKQTDLHVCDGLSEQENKMCRAQLLKDPSICDKNDSWCLATASSNPSYCTQITDSSTKEECIAISTLNPDYYLSDAAKTECTIKADISAKMKIK